MRVNLNEKMSYPTGTGWRRPTNFSSWDGILKGRNSYWTNYSVEHQQLIVDRVETVINEGIDEVLIDFAFRYLESRLGLKGAQVLHISINGSYTSNVSPTYVPQDVDSTIIVDHPFLAVDIVIDPPIKTRRGFEFQDMGFLGVGRIADFTSHPKIFSEVLSHLSGGIPMYGGYFPTGPIEKKYFLMHALRLVTNGLKNLIKNRKYGKALHRLVEARCIVSMIGGEDYVPGYLADSNRIELYNNSDESIRETMRKDLEIEMNQFLQVAGFPLTEAGILVHDNTPFDPPRLNFDDWHHYWEIIKDPGHTVDDGLSVLETRDPNLILMLACHTNSKTLAEIISSRYLGSELEVAECIMKALSSRGLLR